MGIFATIATWVWGFLTAATTAVTAAAASMIGVVTTALAAALGSAWSAVSGLVVGTLTGLGITSAGAGLQALATFGALDITSLTVASYVSSSLAGMTAAFGSFLEIIHFKTLIAVHDLVFLISENYRATMTGVYRDIAQFSSNIGMSSGFMLLALNNARTVILDASAFMGRSYDLGEIAWIEALDNYLRYINTRAKKYRNDPELIFHDISMLMIKPSVNSKATITQIVFENIDNLLKITETVVNDVTRFKFDVATLIDDLPAGIKDQILPEITPYFDAFDDFMRDDYSPVINALSKSISTHKALMTQNHIRIDTIIDRLKRPADYIMEIDRLGSIEKEAQEDKLADISTRSIVRETHNVVKDIDLTPENASELLADYEKPLLPVKWEVPEIETPVKLPIGAIDKSMTWFIEDE